MDRCRGRFEWRLLMVAYRVWSGAAMLAADAGLKTQAYAAVALSFSYMILLTGAYIAEEMDSTE